MSLLRGRMHSQQKSKCSMNCLVNKLMQVSRHRPCCQCCMQCILSQTAKLAMTQSHHQKVLNECRPCLTTASHTGIEDEQDEGVPQHQTQMRYDEAGIDSEDDFIDDDLGDGTQGEQPRRARGKGRTAGVHSQAVQVCRTSLTCTPNHYSKALRAAQESACQISSSRALCAATPHKSLHKAQLQC